MVEPQIGFFLMHIKETFLEFHEDVRTDQASNWTTRVKQSGWRATMKKRLIINIDEDLCNGCGNCITDCAEGALALVDGKAKLVKESFCDGLGACLGSCPTGALSLEERECPDFDETLGGTIQPAGHHQAAPLAPAPAPVKAGFSGCPGTQARMLHTSRPATPPAPVANGTNEGSVFRPEITQWPLQLHLISPSAPFLKNRDLVLVSTCSPLACPDVQWKFFRGRSVAIACPKLDRTDGYVEKLTAILSDGSIPKIMVLRMEVPCCSGLTAMAVEAARRTNRDDLIVEEVTIGIQGEIQHTVDRSPSCVR
jgi:ferredoxin